MNKARSYRMSLGLLYTLNIFFYRQKYHKSKNIILPDDWAAFSKEPTITTKLMNVY